MSWTAPLTWVTGTVVTAAQLNAQIRDNSLFLDSPYGCIAVRNTSQAIAAATLTKIAFNTADIFDNDSMHDTVTNNTRITFNHAGLYHLHADLAWAVTSATGNRWATIELNGTGQVLGGETVGGTTTESCMQNPDAYYLASANDYVELVVYQNSGGSLSVLADGNSLTLGTRTAMLRFEATWAGAGV